MKEQNEKQAIEEMANIMIDIQRDFNEYCAKPCRECEMGGIVNCENYYKAEALYNAGYRKQSVGEWTRIEVKGKNYAQVYYQHKDCEVNETQMFPSPYNFCPNCGARMKGGE